MFLHSVVRLCSSMRHFARCVDVPQARNSCNLKLFYLFMHIRQDAKAFARVLRIQWDSFAYFCDDNNSMVSFVACSGK